MTRSESRELAFTLLFELCFGTPEPGEILANASDARDIEADDYVRELLEKTRDNLEAIDGIIERHSTRWKLSRLPRVSKTILRLAVCEIAYIDGTPDSVAINEAVELAKKYGLDDDPSYINGVLGGYVRSLASKSAETTAE